MTEESSTDEEASIMFEDFVNLQVTEYLLKAHDLMSQQANISVSLPEIFAIHNSRAQEAEKNLAELFGLKNAQIVRKFTAKITQRRFNKSRLSLFVEWLGRQSNVFKMNRANNFALPDVDHKNLAAILSLAAIAEIKNQRIRNRYPVKLAVIVANFLINAGYIGEAAQILEQGSSYLLKQKKYKEMTKLIAGISARLEKTKSRIAVNFFENVIEGLVLMGEFESVFSIIDFMGQNGEEKYVKRGFEKFVTLKLDLRAHKMLREFLYKVISQGSLGMVDLIVQGIEILVSMGLDNDATLLTEQIVQKLRAHGRSAEADTVNATIANFKAHNLWMKNVEMARIALEQEIEARNGEGIYRKKDSQ